MTIAKRAAFFAIAACVACLSVTFVPQITRADDGGGDYTIGGGADYTIGGGSNYTIGGADYTIGGQDFTTQDISGSFSGGCAYCGQNYTIGGADYTIGNGGNYTIGGADYTIGNGGADYTIGNTGADYTIGGDYTIGNGGADYTIGNSGADYTIGGGSDYTTGGGADYTIGNQAYTTGGSTYATGGYTYNTGGYVPGGYYNGGYYGGGYYGGGYIGGGYYGAGGGYVITNPTTIIQPPQPHNCPTGYILSGNQCIPQVVNCPTGYTKDANGQCVPPIVNCPTGYTKDANGQCVPPVVQCPAGYTQTANGCVPPNGTCPSGWTLQNNVCVPPTIYPPYNPYPYPYQYPYYYNSYYGNYATPTCNIYISHQYAAYGTPVTISWSSQYASGGTITYVGPVAPSGSMTVYPTEARTYVGTFNGYNGQTVTCSATLGGTGSTPYVSLSSVPYTGLDLGPVGEVLYWAFLILWCLWMSYLVTVKKIHKTATAQVKHVLFGTPLPKKTAHVQAPHAAAHTTHAHTAVPVAPVAPVAPVNTGSHVDEFILSQINRGKK